METSVLPIMVMFPYSEISAFPHVVIITVNGNIVRRETMAMGRRALLTESEREAIENPDSKDNPYVAISRVRNKIDGELPRDIELLREHRPDLFEQLQAVVCDESETSPEPEPAPSERRDFAANDEQESTTDDEPNPVNERKQAEKRVQELDLAGRGAAYSIRADAVLRMYDHLRDNPGDRVDKDELRGLLEGEDVGYKGGFSSLWSNWVKKNESQGRPTNTLTELPGVEMRGDEYVYTNESV